MIRNGWQLGLMALLVVLVVMNPAIATISDVLPQGTVFIGEEGLNLSATSVQLNSQLGWWSPGTKIDSEPTYLMSVGDPTNFYIDPQVFSGRAGPWYIYPDRTLIFYLQDPVLNLRIYDVDTGKDRTEGKVVRGDELQFRIDTNLYSLKERLGTSGAPITIYVKDETGTTYTSLVNRTGASTSLEDIPVDSSSFLTIPLWDTGNARYSYGSYEIWAECNANHMKDNYPVEGKTITTIGVRNITSIGITISVTTIATPTITPLPVTTTAIITPLPTQETGTLPPTTVTQVSTPTAQPTTVPPTSLPGFLAPSTIIAVMFLAGLWFAINKR